MKESKSETKDPISGMTVDEAFALHAEREGKTYYFCSDHYRQKVLSTPADDQPEGKIRWLPWINNRNSFNREQE